MDSPIFLIGAGFNVDANSQIRSREYRYPLTGDLLEPCFEITELPVGKSIEDLFQNSIEQREISPLQRLCDLVMGADYYFGGQFTNENENIENPYNQFLQKFRDSHFITFNYDSLLEILLFHKKRWKPDDGYGINVHTEIRPFELPKHSNNLVLHLHGSFCVNSVEVYFEKDRTSLIEWMKPLEKPQYVFDPHSITHRFSPYERIHSRSYRDPFKRVIAPIPDKAKNINCSSFVVAVYKKAIFLIKQCDTIVSIGYRFGEQDVSSYESILKALSGSNKSKRLIVISPDAKEIVSRIKKDYHFEIIPLELTFGGWASKGFRLP